MNPCSMWSCKEAAAEVNERSYHRWGGVNVQMDEFKLQIYGNAECSR